MISAGRDSVRDLRANVAYCTDTTTKVAARIAQVTTARRKN